MNLKERAAKFLAIADNATPSFWQARFMHRMFRRVRESPGDLMFGTKPEQDWADCELIEAARNDAPDIIRDFLARQPEPAFVEWLTKHLMAAEQLAQDYENGLISLDEPDAVTAERGRLVRAHANQLRAWITPLT